MFFPIVRSPTLCLINRWDPFCSNSLNRCSVLTIMAENSTQVELRPSSSLVSAKNMDFEPNCFKCVTFFGCVERCFVESAPNLCLTRFLTLVNDARVAAPDPEVPLAPLSARCNPTLLFELLGSWTECCHPARWWGRKKIAAKLWQIVVEMNNKRPLTLQTKNCRLVSHQ